jgi:hypothetical protein
MVPRGVKPYFVHLLPNLFPIARGRVKYLIGVPYKEFDTLLQKSSEVYQVSEEKDRVL